MRRGGANAKGHQGEREIEALLAKHGLDAYTKGGSGRVDGKFLLDLLGSYEVKLQASVPQFLYDHINQNGATSLFMRRCNPTETRNALGKLQGKEWLWAFKAEDLANIIAQLLEQIRALEAQLGHDSLLRELQHLARRVDALEGDVRGMHSSSVGEGSEMRR